MDRILFQHLPAVLAVARSRSFSRAASDLGIGASAVSHSVKKAEERLGAPIFTRTTRSVTLTDAGARFVEAARRAVDDVATVADEVREGQGAVAGTLRINVPRLALMMGLTDALSRLAITHPRLTVEVISDDALSDVVADGFDAGVRLGGMIAQDMIAVRMTPSCRTALVASPGYIETFGSPQNIDDLKHHNCIGYRLLASGAIYQWDLVQDGAEVRVPVAGTVRVSDPSYARQLALAGLGIAYLMEPVVRQDIQSRALVELLADAAVEEPGLFLYFPRRRESDSKLQALVRALRLNASGDLRTASF